MVDRALLFRALHAHFVGFYVLCFVGKVYPWPRIGLLSLGEAVWDEPAQYISMRAPETTRVVPNRESLVTPNNNYYTSCLPPVLPPVVVNQYNCSYHILCIISCST